MVEFAIKFPGNKNDETVYLPIDSKFPMEYFDKLQIAQEAANLPLVEEAGKALDARMKQEAKNIRDKYLDPPNTTEFGIMFLPTESLYAEALRRPGLSDFLRREYRVSIAGPTTIVALLNTFQMGFRTLAVEKRASDVWNLLGNVKKEFGNFASLLENTQTKLESAGKTLGEAASKSRNIERKLKNVQELPSGVQPLLIEESEADAVVE